MNDEQRKYWAQEVAPLKAAMMEAQKRAQQGLSPLSERTDTGYRPLRTLWDAIAALALKEKNATLNDECQRFLRACEAANKLWLQTSHDLYHAAHKRDPVYGGDYVQTSTIIAAYQAAGGTTLMQDINKGYESLSWLLSDLLK
ncbi:MAG: hypothetical protein ABSF69_20520 [Polyangiaceae bacterium]|jgi:hypothetical protein